MNGDGIDAAIPPEQWSIPALVYDQPGNDEEDPEVHAAVVNNVILAPYSKGRMYLLSDERSWANQIKERVENMPELDNLSDYWYAQLTLVELGDTHAALERVVALQQVRQEYKIVDSLVEAKRALREGLRLGLFPDLLAFDFNLVRGGLFLAWDMAKQENKAAFKSNPRAEDIVVKQLYFIYQALTCDMEAIRRGHTMMIECEGYSLTSGVDMSMIRMFLNVVEHYPINVQAHQHYNNGVLANAILSMGRKLLPSDLQEKVHFGLRSPERLDRIFLNPTPEAAMARMLAKIDAALERRYRNESIFALGK